MGVDCTIYARKAQKWCDQDRLYTLQPPFDGLTHGTWDLLEARHDVPAAKVSAMLLEALSKNIPDNKKGWCQLAIDFVAAHPDDLIFIRNDHDWSDSNEYYHLLESWTEWTPNLLD